MSNSLSKVDFSFEPEERTQAGMVSGQTLSPTKRDDGRFELSYDSGEKIGLIPNAVIDRLGNSKFIMTVNKDCRTVDVTIVTAGKVAGTAINTGINAWAGCLCLVLFVVLAVFMLATCSSML